MLGHLHKISGGVHCGTATWIGAADGAMLDAAGSGLGATDCCVQLMVASPSVRMAIWMRLMILMKCLLLRCTALWVANDPARWMSREHHRPWRSDLQGVALSYKGARCRCPSADADSS